MIPFDSNQIHSKCDLHCILKKYSFVARRNGHSNKRGALTALGQNIYCQMSDVEKHMSDP